jgi:transposase-like protein
MSDCSLFGKLEQVSGSEAGAVFRSFIRGHVRELVCRVMAEEVSLLCGPKHQPAGASHFRSGTSPGRIYIDGKREEVIRPRVRSRKADGGSEEVWLQSYQSASDPGELEASILAALKAGVSTREVADVAEEAHGTGRSKVSRLWQSVGHEFVAELRGRDLSQSDWVVLMLDGLVLSEDQTAVVAVGIDSEGQKHVLDFELGSSENKEICLDLLRRVKTRGFTCKRRLFGVLDGSDALKSALVEFFPDAVIQRCLVHKERNIRAKLSKRHWGELARLFKRLREVQGA